MMMFALIKVLKRLRPILIIPFITNCGIIPLNSVSNIDIKDQDRSFQEALPETALSGYLVASSNIDWSVPEDCRADRIYKNMVYAALENKIFGSEAESIKTKFNTSVKLAKFFRPSAKCAQKDENFIALALSGGGMRAAVFSAAVMFELKNAKLLKKIDVISSVSGGSITAALYGMSCDQRAGCPATVEIPNRCLWIADDSKEEEKDNICERVFEQLNTNLEIRFIGNMFWPDNIIRYWLTHYDRSDIMAETISDNFYDTSKLGGEGFKFQDLNPQRPNIIINATNFTLNNYTNFLNGKAEDVRKRLLEHLNFQFTWENFKENLCSDIGDYPLANAVMASSAFPGVFQYMTLERYCNKNDIFKKGQYVHIFDGGNSDNLGLIALEKIINKMHDTYLSQSKIPEIFKSAVPKRITIFESNASLGLPGKDANNPDPRGFFDYIIDTNFIDTTDSLMVMGYNSTVTALDTARNNLRKIQCEEYREDACPEINNHIRFLLTDLKPKKSENMSDLLFHKGPQLWRCISKIGTRLTTNPKEIILLRLAAQILVDNQLSQHKTYLKQLTGYDYQSMSEDTIRAVIKKVNKYCENKLRS